MTLLPAPGPQLSQGRIRVDAARAIAKLREYQLVDRTTWVLEAIRAAVASGATRIELAADSNDVWLAWEGPAWPAEQLPLLFDELVSPEPEQAHHHYRLLATAINSALGLAPAFVDVVTIVEGSAPLRVRYRPDVLEMPAPSASGDLDDSPLRRLATEPIARDSEWPAIGTGMVVHYRRRAGLEVLKLFVGLARAPEIVHALAACHALPVPLHVGGSILWREARDRDVVRVPLGEPIDGHVAVVDPRTLTTGDTTPVAEIAERGVVLARYPLDLGLGSSTHPMPVRVFVDAPRLPTNASRSEVRRDAHPLPLAEERATVQVAALLEALHAACKAEEVPRAAREAALALIAADHPDHTRLASHRGELGGLLDLPLVKDACGQPRALARTWQPFVHRGRSPLPAELSPWLSEVLWVTEDIVERLVTVPSVRSELRDHVRWAHRQLRARDWFYGHQPRPLRVDTTSTPRVRARVGAPLPGSCLDDARVAGASGEVCLLEPGRSGDIVILLERRELDRVQFTGKVDVAAVVDDPRITPGDRYRRAQRDEALRRLENIVSATVVRAAEAIALNLAGEPIPDGYEVAPADPEHDVPLLMDVFELVSHVPGESPLANAPLWRVRGKGRASLRELRAEAVIALASMHAYVPPGRLVVEDGDRDLLEWLLRDTQLVPYGSPATSRMTEHDLAMGLLAQGCEHALGIEHGTLRGAIAVLDADSAISHAGVQLQTWRYPRSTMQFTIVVDCDEVIPTPVWDGLADDLGIPRRDFTPWERRFARAIARALIGDRDPALVGGPLELESATAEALFAMFDSVPPSVLLEPELAAQLRRRPLLSLLGDPQPRSIDELEELFPHALVFVGPGHDPIDGFTPLVASPALARSLGALAGKQCVDGEPELARLVRQRLRTERLAKHRALPEAAVALPYETPRVQQTTARSRGQIGVAQGGFELHVFVEGRPFEIVRRADELPVVAALDVSADLVDATFEALTPAAHAALLEDIHGAVPALLEQIASDTPTLFGDPGGAQQLLHASLARLELSPKLRGKLRSTRGFLTVQGKRASISQATRGELLLVGDWSQDWLGPDGEPMELDEPILRIDASQVHEIAKWLHGGLVRDCSDDLARLQAQRQMARGLLPIPAIPGASPAVRRTFGELGETELGFGEVALADADGSHALIHVAGKLHERVAIDVQPAVDIAIEAPESTSRPDGDVLTVLELRSHPIERIAYKLQRVATKLVQTLAQGELPPPYDARLRRAVLSGSFDGARIPTAAIFHEIDGSRADWTTVEQQRLRFGNVWAVPEPTLQRPLDPERRVLVLTREEIELAIAAKRFVVDARRELALDDTARQNRARPRATSLALPGAVSFLATAKLPGDGLTVPRGHVGVLAPATAHMRMMHAHREMHPFDPVADPCAWPSITVLDDGRLEPDRLWRAPEGGPIWHEVLSEVRAASETAIATVVTIPATALVSERITNVSHDGLPSLASNPKVRIRGALWLDGEPRSQDPPPPIQIIASQGRTSFVHERAQGLTGRLLVHAPDGFHEDTIVELCAAVYGRLVRALVLRRADDLTLAHVAHALAMGRLQPVDVRGARLPCFVPAPLEPAAWVQLLATRKKVPIVQPKERSSGVAVVADNSAVARVVQSWLDLRGTFVLPIEAAAIEQDGPRHSARVDGAPGKRPAPKPSLSPVEELVQRVANRLVTLDVTCSASVIAREEPLVAYADGLVFAGLHPQLRAVAAAMLEGAAWVGDAIDALAAHALTVMNVALAEVTDATEINALGALLDAS